MGMNWRQILDQIATGQDTRGNFITDGKLSVKYEEIAGLLDDISAVLDAHGIVADTCLAVECANSVPAALLLLTLLRGGNSFALVPPSVSSEIKPTPRFCQSKITVGAGAASLSAGSFLTIESNPEFNGKPMLGAKLFLRTSGSMGASKIVVHDHSMLMGNADNCVRKYSFSPASRCVIPVPLAHMYGFGAEFLPAILAGASIDLQEKTNVIKYLDREKKFQPTIAFVTPAICEMLVKAYKTPRTCYEVMVTSGQRIGDEIFRAFDPLIGGRLINQYGSTEMGATAACDPGDSLDRRLSTIGKPMRGVELRIAGTASGDLFVKHPYGFEGYLDEAGEWLRKAEPDGWYRTGDLARTQSDGSIAVLGRSDESVNRSGYLVLLADIERVLEQNGAIGKVVVVAGKAEGKRGERIAAFCVPPPNSPMDSARITAYCFDVLPKYAVPDAVHVAASLPMLPSGKIDKQALVALIEQ